MKDKNMTIITTCAIIVTTITVIFFSYKIYTDYQDRKMIGNLMEATDDILKTSKIPKNQKFPSSKENKTAYSMPRTENRPVQNVTYEKRMPTDKDIRRYLKAWNMFLEQQYTDPILVFFGTFFALRSFIYYLKFFNHQFF